MKSKCCGARVIHSRVDASWCSECGEPTRRSTSDHFAHLRVDLDAEERGLMLIRKVPKAPTDAYLEIGEEDNLLMPILGII